MKHLEDTILRKLGIEDEHFVEIESKRRVVPEEMKEVRRYLEDKKGVKELGQKSFFDQFLDTPRMEVLKAGASLRLRYKKDGTFVYLQYKGPGFHQNGLLYRSEFSSGRLEHVLLEESHHDVVHFTETSIKQILRRHVEPEMAEAMQRHLGRRVVADITRGPILCLYQKDKFQVDLGRAFLEPSLDRLFAFHVNLKGLHSLSTFCEYENEIKSDSQDLTDKLSRLEELFEFDEKISKRFDMPAERLDKYHRCASTFVRRR